ncbi:GNAT family N-acetyltransferase [Schumannella sp. 10F1B-5-1]|uniref:GNAT family N-acetyltransferase n=1 Tax=Schumannella sp. 10F1B-5-1 TaxID=2590780 RepID=UPI001132424F|nr:GNAT family N-acetyltransferase [Schumannella sp. 10F1B-5-1]TPW71536.1 GNAT family N-acetyltransferase [Schumannella sp. 10F1B-5-1]
MPTTIETGIPQRDEAVALYESVGWTIYVADPERLMQAFHGSDLVVTARDEVGRLVGLARTVSDGATIVYLQDLLVVPELHRQGVGGALLDEVLRRSSRIRQFVLLTDDDESQRAFYEAHGLVEVSDIEPRPLRSFVRIG